MRFLVGFLFGVMLVVGSYFLFQYHFSHEVCGQDTKTYESFSSLNEAGVNAQYLGSCVYTDVATGDVQPIDPKTKLHRGYATLVQWVSKW